MKRAIILIIFIITGLVVFSQSGGSGQLIINDEPSWVGMVQDKNANFFDVQKSFYNYWLKHKWVKGYGYKVFKRWEWFMEHRIDENGYRLPERKVFDEYLKTINRFKSLSGNWHELGPVTRPDNWTHGPNGLGRVNTIEFHPTDTNIIYAGTPSGGLWKTIDGGLFWYCTTDNLPTLGVSSIVIDYSDPEIVYIGTGDRDAYDAPGLGVMKTVNGGFTWDFMNSVMGNVIVSKIIMHPINHNILLAATSDGIYKTTDGGSTWYNVSGNSSFYKDITFKPGNPDVVYASSSTFYRSTDGGEHFDFVISAMTSSLKKLIGVSPANPEVVYVLSSNTYSFKAFYKSVNSGVDFTLQCDTPNILGYEKDGSDDNGQAWYDMCLAVDPDDETTIYVGGINIWISHDSGHSWIYNVGGSLDDSTYIHVDQHYLGFSPLTKYLYSGNDGGVYITSDSGQTWHDISQGLAIAQIYRIGQSPSVRDLVINGNQDNGSTVYDNGNWRTVLGADGMECQFDPDDPDIFYGSYYYGSIHRSFDAGDHTNWIGGSGYGSINESGAWISPFGLHVSNSNTMFLGLKNLWRTNNVKEPDHENIVWSKITQNISNPDSVNLRTVEQSPANSNVYYFSREDKKFFRSDDVNSASPSWTNLTSGLPASAWPYDIECHPSSQNIVYIILANHIYKSTDKGIHWISINGSLPDVAKNCLVCEPGSADGIYAGTDIGIFYRNNTMGDWIFFSHGFPPAAEVTELEIYYDTANLSNNRLRASTYGRGLWESDLYSSQNNPPVADFTADNNIQYPGVAVQFTDLSQFYPDNWLWNVYPSTYNFMDGTTANSQNPVISFYEFANYTISLTVTNSYGTDTKIAENYISIINGINPPVNEMEIKIFPNPAKDLINISISSSKYKSFNMDIYNPNGMVIKTTNINISGDYYSASYDLNDFNK
jgi:PKD repeat protein/photosystem II stability/assembly factor-like uncharacterized protein